MKCREEIESGKILFLNFAAMNFQKISDKELYKKCVMYGKQALQARRKFIGLLPEVYKRRLFEKKGFGSVYEFAARLAGVSHELVNRVLQLERKFESMTVLHSALTGGEISVNKLARIVSIATSENESELKRRAELLSSRALEVFVRETKRENCTDDNYAQTKNGAADHFQNKNQIGLFEPIQEAKSVHVHRLESEQNVTGTQKINLAADVENELLEMQRKGIDVNAFLRAALQKRKGEIENEKEKLRNEETQVHEEKAIIGMPGGRYIPIKIRKIVLKEHGKACSKPNCNNPAAQLHHENRFAKFRLHDPNLLKPLCRAHHELEHSEEKSFQFNRRGCR